MFEVMAGFDSSDPTSAAVPVPAARAELDRGIAGLPIGFDRSYSTDNVEPDPVRALDAVLAELAGAGADIVDAADWAGLVLTDIHAKPVNYSGSPELSVPFGFSTDGLPLSIQFAGVAASEPTICRVGHAFERASRWHSRHPPV